ncbi:MAG: quinone-dependent dihydroorotate dehydrogenase [Anaerolineaceae bacterium]|nr:quinone-dependent dihydroorotate dehydrogenase [Anaerolineaceae bacterium]
MSIYKTLRPLIYTMDGEKAHDLTISLLNMAGKIAPMGAVMHAMFKAKQNGPTVKAFGLSFQNPIGMAAGYDKDGLGWRGLANLGFGHIELGTVTPVGQPGNPRKRVFRLVEDQAVINRMGFPNSGADFILKQVQGEKPEGLILGMNIGKNKDTPLEEAENDYLPLLRTFAPHVDYLAVNVSSPNTPGLRKLQTPEFLENLLSKLDVERNNLVQELNKPVPILLKLAPDMQETDLAGALEAAMRSNMDGLIMGNTTISRPSLLSADHGETGGLSGLPLRDLNTRMLKRCVQLTDGKLPIIASGGVMNADDAQEKLDAGAVLVQIYTGMIYHGPGMVRDILNAGIKNN